MSKLEEYTWPSLLFYSFLRVNKTTIKHLLAVGAVDWYNISREQQLFEHDIALKLTKKEVEWIKNNLDLQQFISLEPIFQHILSLPVGKNHPISNKNRQNIIKGLHFTLVKPPYHVKYNSIRRISVLEASYLGIALSCHKTDDTEENLADSSIKDLLDGKKGKLTILVEIAKIKEITTSKGDLMAFITVEDATGSTDVVAFSNIWSKNKPCLFEGNLVLIVGQTTKQGSLSILSCKGV